MFFTFLLLSRAEENATSIDSLIEEVKYTRAIVEKLIEKLQNQKFQTQRRPNLYQLNKFIAQNQYNRAIMQNQYNRAIMQNQYNRALMQNAFKKILRNVPHRHQPPPPPKSHWHNFVKPPPDNMASRFDIML